MLKRTLTAGTAMVMGLALLAGCQSEDKAAADKTVKDAQTATAADPVALMRDALETAKSTKGDGDPAIWLLEDKDTKIYMIGTVHILPDDVQWRTDEFNKIFSSVDTLYLETDVSAEAQAGAQAMMMEYAMFEDGQTLTSVLGDDVEVVSAAFEELGVPMAGFDGFKPWMGAMTLQVMSMMKDGYNVESGVETVLEKEARANGIEFGYLETMEEQMQFISGGTMEQQVEGLVFTAKTMDLGKEVVDTIVDEWVDGDIEGMGAIIASPSSLGSQDMYDRLLVERNTNWVPLIEDILDAPGNKLVAVGAGHLAGPDSVITMLENKGHTIKVVQ